MSRGMDVGATLKAHAGSCRTGRARLHAAHRCRQAGRWPGTEDLQPGRWVRASLTPQVVCMSQSFSEAPIDVSRRAWRSERS